MNKPLSRFPELDPVRSELHRLKTIWMFCCLSPIAYLGLALMVQENNWVHFVQLSPAEYRLIGSIFIAAALSVEIGIWLVRRRYDRAMRRIGRAVVQLLELYSKRTYLLMALCETAIFLGFLFFVLSRDLYVMLFAGCLGLLYYAQSYPSERSLGQLTRSVGK
jgi:hypothetical protein